MRHVNRIYKWIESAKLNEVSNRSELAFVLNSYICEKINKIPTRKMYPKWIVNILRIYHLYGFYKIQIEKSTSFIVLLVHIILCFFASVAALAAIFGDHRFF